MKTSIITGTTLTLALLTSAAVQAGTALEQEPHANFAIDQNISQHEASSSNAQVDLSQNGTFWGWDAGTVNK